jgi:hypothetical protein
MDVHLSTTSKIENSHCDFLLEQQTNLTTIHPESEKSSNANFNVDSVNIENHYQNSENAKDNNATEQTIHLSSKDTNFLSKQGMKFPS